MRRTSNPSRLAAVVAAAALGALSASCRWATPPGVYFATEPPGAEVVIDGRRSGHVTPCMIALDEDSEYEVTLALGGYQPRHILLLPAERVHRVQWSDGSFGSGTISPLALSAGDLFLPYVRNEAHSPSRIFLRLLPAGSGATPGGAAN